MPSVVIDHHLNGTNGARLEFKDVRPRVAAAASIAACYLREQRLEPGPKLATAMQYAIRTETCACETRHSRLDRSAIVWLTSRAEHRVARGDRERAAAAQILRRLDPGHAEHVSLRRRGLLPVAPRIVPRLSARSRIC